VAPLARRAARSDLAPRADEGGLTVPILGRYILRTVLGYTALALLVLLALGALFLFISEQDDIGTGSYAASHAMTFVLLNLPTFAGQLLPVAALIGALLGLGNLARGSELVVMRASGITTAQFCGWLAVAGLVLAVLMVGLSEFVAPPLEKYARQVKVFSKYSEFSFAGNRGTWVRDDDTIVGIDQQSALSTFGGVQIFRFDPDRRLLSVGRAESAEVNRKNTWKLRNYAETRFSDDGTAVRKEPVEEIRSSLSPDFLGLAVVEPQAMGIRDLRTYTRHLQRNSLDSSRFEVAFWSRVARIAALMLVLILALPFALGPMRNTGQGARTVIGILIGAGFVLLSQTLENSGQILGLSPPLIGWLPTAILAALTLVMLSRAR
jgi:lipopolysaccharide export system permease protein